MRASDARTKYFESEERSYIGKTYVPSNPTVLQIGRAIANFLIKGSFSDMEITGIDQTVDMPGRGRVSLSQLLAAGGAGIVSTHRMYFDIPEVVLLSNRLGI